MQIINIKNGVESGLIEACIAIGNFDGIHKGHAAVINKAKDTANKFKKPIGVFTFEPHPISVFAPKLRNYRLTPFEAKMHILESMEIDFVVYAEFNENFSKISANDFVETFLKNKLKASAIFTGEDFIFGHNRVGNPLLLKNLGKKYGFSYYRVQEVKNDGGLRFSSSLARDLIRDGWVEEAAKILGRNYFIEGKVIKGAGRAFLDLGFATANIDLGEYVIPKFGVYEVVVRFDNIKLKAIANIGIKPTYGENKPLLEVHILNFSKDIYEKNISVEIIKFIREERKFDSVERLKNQIKNDIKLINI